MKWLLTAFTAFLLVQHFNPPTPLIRLDLVPLPDKSPVLREKGGTLHQRIGVRKSKHVIDLTNRPPVVQMRVLVWDVRLNRYVPLGE